jgi:hypothetical protein
LRPVERAPDADVLHPVVRPIRLYVDARFRQRSARIPEVAALHQHVLSRDNREAVPPIVIHHAMRKHDVFAVMRHLPRANSTFSIFKTDSA